MATIAGETDRYHAAYLFIYITFHRIARHPTDAGLIGVSRSLSDHRRVIFPLMVKTDFRRDLTLYDESYNITIYVRQLCNIIF